MSTIIVITRPKHGAAGDETQTVELPTPTVPETWAQALRRAANIVDNEDTYDPPQT